MILHRDTEVLTAFNKCLDATFMGAGDSEGNQPFSDLQDAYAALYGTLAMQRHVASTVRYMGGYEAPCQIRSCEETAQYMLIHEDSLPPQDKPKAWRVIAGDALQRVLTRGCDDNTGNHGWGAHVIVPYPTLESFLDRAPHRNDYGIVNCFEKIEEADILRSPWSLGMTLFRLAARFKASQHERITLETKGSADATIHVFPPTGHPRLYTGYADPVFHLRAKGYLAVTK